MIRTLFDRADNKDNYILHDSWNPSFSTELELAVSTFHSDDAFHRAFGGENIQLEKSVVTDYFVGMISRSRCMPTRYIITVRRKNRLLAFAAGFINCGEGGLGKLTDAIREKKVLLKNRYHLQQMTCAFHEARYKKNSKNYGASIGTEFEARQKEYSNLLSSPNKTEDVFFRITMVAVHPEEQRQGHLRKMLEQLLIVLKGMPLLSYISITTYDPEKVKLYMRLGFQSPTETTNNELHAWELQLPLHP